MTPSRSPRYRRGQSRAPRSELSVFLSPLSGASHIAWRRRHLLLLASVALYALSGVTVIDANEVGVVLRLGAVTRAAGKPTVHPPGIVYALPRPFDTVLTVDADRIDTITIDELAPPEWGDRSPDAMEIHGSLDPEIDGYILTGDRNVLHTQIIARYRISNPVDFCLLASSPLTLLRSAILESTIATAGASRLDDLLGGGREFFTRTVAADAQSRLDHIRAGLEIVSLEFQTLVPPHQVAADFDAVQSAYIESQTSSREAHSYAARIVPAAEAAAREIIAQAEAMSTRQVAEARAQAAAFAALLPSYQANPQLVAYRLYREAVEHALDRADQVRFVPAPLPDGYRGARFMISLPSRPASSADAPAKPEAPRDLSAAGTEGTDRNAAAITPAKARGTGR